MSDGRYKDMVHPHPLLDKPREELSDGLAEELVFHGMNLEEEFPIHFTSSPHPFPEMEDGGGDFWDEDPAFDEEANLRCAEEFEVLMHEQDARAEEQALAFERVEGAPLRHYKKRR